MATNCCHQFLAFNLKLLNFFQFFAGISTVTYSAYLLNKWQNQAPIVPPLSPPPPSPFAPAPSYRISFYSDNGLFQLGGQMDRINLPGFVSGSDPDMGLIAQLQSIQLPAPWFIYFLMMVGGLLCCMSCIGHIAAEAINGCCLCFYFLLEIVLISIEGALVAFIAIDQRWEKDLPFDQTGELEKLKSFIEEYADICKWLGISLLTFQALSLLLSLVLRAMVSTRRLDSDTENDYAAAGHGIREPLLNSLSNQAAGSTKSEGRGTFSDIWTTRIRQKYGLNNESSKQTLPNASSSTRV